MRRRPLRLTPLVIIAVLTLVLHVATGIVLDRSHAGPADAALDDAGDVPGGNETAATLAAVRLEHYRLIKSEPGSSILS